MELKCCGACKHMVHKDANGAGLCDAKNMKKVFCAMGCNDLFKRKEDNRKRIKVYLSGKVSGLDLDIAKKRFADAAEDCRLLLSMEGYDIVEVVNPLDIPAPSGMEWADYMLLDLQLLRHCDAIMMMPGWENSVGAVIENSFSERSGKKVYYLEKKIINRQS